MRSAPSYAAAFRQRRKEAGWRKLSFYLRPEEAEALERLKVLFGTDEATVRAALVRLAADALQEPATG